MSDASHSTLPSFSTSVAALKAAITPAAAVTVRGGSKPILQHIHLGAADQRLTATGTDHSISVTSSLPVAVTKPGTAIIEPTPLARALAASSDGEVRIQPEASGQRLEVHLPAGVLRLPVVDELYPLPQPIDGATPLPSMSAPVLRHALSTVAPAMEAAASSPVLSGTLMDMGPTGTVFAATDGKILIEAAHQDIRTQDPDQRHRIIIPGATVSKVGTLLESGHGPIALASNGKTLSMRWAGEIPDHAVEVQTRSIDGAYPAYKPALQPAATSAKIRLHRAQTTNTLALLAALGTDAGRGVVLRPGDNGIGTIENLGGGSVSGNRHGTFQVPMTVVTSDGSPFSRIGFNSDLMMKALKAVPPAENESVVLSSHRGLIASGTRTIDDQSATVTALVMPITLPE